MSTDYGLRCLDCDTSIVPDNMGEYAVEIVMKQINELADLSIAYEKSSASVELSAYWYNGDSFQKFIAWLNEHRSHRLVMVDEYGKEYPKTTKLPRG